MSNSHEDMAAHCHVTLESVLWSFICNLIDVCWHLKIYSLSKTMLVKCTRISGTVFMFFLITCPTVEGDLHCVRYLSNDHICFPFILIHSLQSQGN